ncbi:MAG: MFS transporter [Bacillus sp. (in: Bacteria)]|nr:MFS transporter [Bacillus sp. (in: firmicutes)]MCM1427654.1 MFS transporter [Eubacterium sp.]
MEILFIVIALFMKEPERSGVEEKISVRKHFDITYSLLKGNREVIHILSFYAVLFAFYTSIFFYSQQFYYERGFSRTAISLILLGMGACSCLGALCSERLCSLLGKRACRISGVCMAIGLIGVGCPISAVSVCGFGISSFFNSMLYPLQSAQLNKRIPSGQRATIISVSSMFFSLVMVVLFPLIGLLGDIFGLQKVVWMAGGVLLGFVVIG